MEKRAILAIAVSFVILLLWTWIFPPPEREAAPVEEAPASIEGTDETRRLLDPPPGEETEPTTPETAYDEVESIGAVAEEEVLVETEAFIATLTNRGGRGLSWQLRDYTEGDGRPVELIGHYTDSKLLPLAVVLENRALTAEINTALFEVEREQTLTSSGEAAERVTFRWSDGRGIEVRKAFTFPRTGWLVDIELEVLDRGRPLDVQLTLGPGFSARRSTSGAGTYYYSGQGVWNLGGSVTHYRHKKMVGEDSGLRGNLRWAGLEDQYFAGVLIPGDQPATVDWHSLDLLSAFVPEDEDEEIEPRAEPIIAVSVGPAGAQLFFGPKEYKLLEGLGHQLEKAVWFSSNGFLYAISKYLFFVLHWLHDNVIANWGMAIILATAALRLVLFPVNQYSMVSMRKTQQQMQRVQPKIKAIKAKYAKRKDAESRQKMQQETMELYRKEGINPMGGLSGCLPLLAQFPILIGFYNMLTVTVELRGAPFFGWIQDLSLKDPYWILPLLMGVTMFAQQKMAMSKVKDPTQAQQQKIMMFMPFFFTYICLQMPSGMVLYWFVNNLLGIGQQWLVNRHAGRLDAAAQKA